MSKATESLAALRSDVGTRRREGLPDAWAARLDALHRDGLAAFDAMGWPTRRLERWKGTSLAALEAIDFLRIGAAGGSRIGAAPDADLVFVDGRCVTTPSEALPTGVRVLSLREAMASGEGESDALGAALGRLADPKTDPFVALSSALFEDVAVVALDANVRPGRPIRIRFASTADGPEAASACFPRLLFLAGANSEGMVVFESANDTPDAAPTPGLTSLVAEFVLEAGARIEAIELLREAAPRVHVTQTFAELGRDARFASRVFALGDGLTRDEVTVRLREPGALTKMHGFSLGRGDAHIDHYTTALHEAPHCASDEEYRGVFADRSAGVFRGRVVVHPGAQKTDARQSNPNLLLSDRASIDTKPQLEIYADDVKASHGATIGQLDEDALFFLRARGLDADEARLLLVRGFAQSLVDDIVEPTTRERVAARVAAALETLETSDIPDLSDTSHTPERPGASS